ncbi:MAG TPA: hypothetical protein VL866_24250 [Pyrinomonadaceae bacterium]|nr:hypothetical protein [Pyrinomonadaceae bacterium]
MRRANLKNIKEGDRVWVDYDRKQIICTVVRLTPKQVVTDWPWGKDGARFYRGKLSRYDKQPHYRKIGYSGWYGSEIQAIATKSQCAEYDAAQEQRKQEAERETLARQEKEAHRGKLNALFGKRMVCVYESHHNKSAEWLVHVSLTTQGVIKLAALLEALTMQELPSWETD